MVPYGPPGMMPPPYGAGMPPPHFPPPMPPGGPGYGPPPGGMMMMPPPGLGDPVGFLLPSLFKAIGGLFGGRRPPPPPPSGNVTMMPAGPGMMPLPQMFYHDRPQFCRIHCAPVPGAAGGGGGRRRRRRSGGRLGEPVGAIPLIAALAPLAASVIPQLIRGLTGGGQNNLSGYGYGYYGEPPPPPGYGGYGGW